MNTGTDTVAVPANTPTKVPMPNAGAALNLTIAPDIITIQEAGHYLVTYNVYPQFTAAAPSDLTFAVHYKTDTEDKTLDETVSVASAPAGVYSVSYIGSAIVVFPQGAQVDVTVNSTTPVSMVYDSSTISSLILLKLD